MLVECVARPELREPVHELIQRVAQEHRGGAFQIPLTEMFAAFGLSLGEAEQNKLRGRGDLSFTPTGASYGDFTNEGRQQELATGQGLTLVVPEKLAGTYVTTKGSLTLKFAEGS